MQLVYIIYGALREGKSREQRKEKALLAHQDRCYDVRGTPTNQRRTFYLVIDNYDENN